MTMRSWIRSLFTRPVTHTVRRAARRARPALPLPAVEMLEERWLPSTFMVTDTSDSAADTGSLRYAINNLAAGSSASTNTINFSLPADSVITLSNGALTIAQGVTINGPAAGVTVSGGGASRVFQVDASVAASISGVTITDGNVSGNGGGLYDLGTTTLANCTISGNTASASGGGAYSQGSSVMLTLTNCTISGNTAHNGGGLYNTRNATLTLTDCTISGNNAAFNGGLVNGNSGSLSLAGTATLTDCTISGNTATGNGGGMGNTGAATLTNCTISGNSAGSGHNGGGIYDTGEPSSTLTLTNCTVSDNSAAGGSGGGLYTDDTVTLNNTIDAGNTAGTDPDVDGRDSYDFNGSYNLIGTGTGIAGSISNGVNGNQVGTGGSPINPDLTALGYYGGPTQTMALAARQPRHRCRHVLRRTDHRPARLRPRQSRGHRRFPDAEFAVPRQHQRRRHGLRLRARGRPVAARRHQPD